MVLQSFLAYLMTKSKIFPWTNSSENVSLCSVDNIRSSTRSRLLRSESISPKVSRSSLLMPANKTEYDTDSTKAVEIPECTDSENQQSAMLDESKKAKKNTTKGVSMSEVIRLHQVCHERTS